MRRLYSLTALFFWSFALYASNGNHPAGARSGAMGNASVNFQTLYSAFHNQAGLGWLERPQVAIAYRNNFLLAQTGFKSAALALPVNKVGVFAFSVNSLGFSNYGEHKFGLAYARKFGNVFSMGLQIDYLRTEFVAPYGSKGVIMGQFGVQGKLTENFIIGAHIYNPTRAYLDQETKDRVPTVIRAGLEYNFSKKLITALELEKDLDFQKPNFKVGVEYKPKDVIAIRGGFNSLHAKFSFGLGLYLGNFTIDLASEFHQSLGVSPQASLSYVISKKKKTSNAASE